MTQFGSNNYQAYIINITQSHMKKKTKEQLQKLYIVK